MCDPEESKVSDCDPSIDNDPAINLLENHKPKDTLQKQKIKKKNNEKSFQKEAKKSENKIEYSDSEEDQEVQ